MKHSHARLCSVRRSFGLIVTHEGLLPTGIVRVRWQRSNQQLQVSPKPCVAHYFRPTPTHTEGSAISCVYRHGSGPTLGGHDSPVSRLTVRHELTCRLPTRLIWGETLRGFEPPTFRSEGGGFGTDKAQGVKIAYRVFESNTV